MEPYHSRLGGGLEERRVCEIVKQGFEKISGQRTAGRRMRWG